MAVAGRYMRGIIRNTTKPDGQSEPSKRNIVAIATILGFFISIFSAFTVEFFQKNPL